MKAPKLRILIFSVLSIFFNLFSVYSNSFIYSNKFEYNSLICINISENQLDLENAMDIEIYLEDTIYVTDIDGNKYKVVQIGKQLWMAENLKTTHYSNGDSILNIKDDVEWSNRLTGAWCYFNNDESNNIKYGKLYNWYAVVNDKNICPLGWHIPSREEWNILINYLGGKTVAGAKLKSTDKQYWTVKKNHSSNSSGFSAVPASSRNCKGGFNQFLGMLGIFWSSSEFDSINAFMFEFNHWNTGIIYESFYKRYGNSVRCIKN